MNSHLLDGVVVPAVTVLDADARPHAEGAAPLLAHLAGAGLQKLMLFGSNGEGALLEPDEAAAYGREVAAEWRRLAGPRATIFTAVYAAGTRQSLATAEAYAKACDPDAIVGAAPLYFRHGPEQVAGHIAALATLGKPVIGYNIPRYTGNPFTVDTVRHLADSGVVAGIKDSSGERDVFLEAVKCAQASGGRFAVSQGVEGEMVWALENGAAGITPGYSSLAPALARDLHAAAREGRSADAASFQAAALELMEIHSLRPGVPAMKAALAHAGLCTRYVSAPLVAYDDAESVRISEILEAWIARHGSLKGQRHGTG